jgi:AraC-like DNA-binding protein
MIHNVHFRIFKLEWIRIGREWNAANVRDSFWRYYRNDEDGARLLLDDNRSVELAAGRRYFVPSDVRFTCQSSRSLDHFYAHFDVIGLPRRASSVLFNSPIPIPNDAALDLAAAEAETMRRTLPDDDLLLQFRMKAVLYSALAEVIASLPEARRQQYWNLANLLQAVQPALDWIDSNLSGQLTVRVLADRCSLSEDYFIKRFRESVGTTPNRYVQERRLAVAAQELLFTAHSIEQIAERAGFANRHYFTRQFTRHYAESPAAYRKRTRV